MSQTIQVIDVGFSPQCVQYLPAPDLGAEISPGAGKQDVFVSLVAFVIYAGSDGPEVDGLVQDLCGRLHNASNLPGFQELRTRASLHYTGRIHLLRVVDYWEMPNSGKGNGGE